MPIKKIVTWLIVIFLVYYLVTKPHSAAAAMHGILSWLDQAGKSLSTFVSNL